MPKTSIRFAITTCCLVIPAIITVCQVEAHADEISGLHNLIRVSDRIYSGSEPTGAASFAYLAEIGITTLVSVDGARPDVDGAKAYGLEYVHIPIGYDEVDANAQSTMAKVLAEREGPVYVHCHHGKHRGPAMAAIAWRIEDDVEPATAINLLERAETSPDYSGLYRSVAHFDSAVLNVDSVVLHSTAPVSSVAEEMAEISRIIERLQLCKRSDWQVPSDHEDIAPEHEATMLAERLRELIRTGELDEMHAEMRRSERLAWEFRDVLRKGTKETRDNAFRELRRSCRDCHETYRN